MLWHPTIDPDVTLLVGRCLVAALFIQSGISKPLAWNAALDELVEYGMPRSALALAPALVAQLVGGLLLCAGLLTFWASAALLAFMVPATFYIHGFWRYSGAAREHHFVGFFQNLTMSGGLVLLLATGPGTLSLDHWLAK